MTKRVKSYIYEDYSVPKIGKCNFGKNYWYRSINKKLSLLCLCEGVIFDVFKIFDSYDETTT